MPRGREGRAPADWSDAEIEKYYERTGVTRVITDPKAVIADMRPVEIPPYNPVEAYRNAETLEEKVAVLARKVLGIRERKLEIVRAGANMNGDSSERVFHCPNAGCSRFFDTKAGLTLGHLPKCEFKEAKNGSEG